MTKGLSGDDSLQGETERKGSGRLPIQGPVVRETLGTPLPRVLKDWVRGLVLYVLGQGLG